MAEKQSELPPGVELFSLHDEADSYQSRMDLIVKSAVMGLGLVLMILLLTLRFTVAVWVTVGIAISFVGAFIFCRWSMCRSISCRCLHFFWCWGSWSMTRSWWARVFITIEKSSVSMRRKPQLPEPRRRARPVVFAVLTTVVAFAPWAFLSGTSERVFAPFISRHCVRPDVFVDRSLLHIACALTEVIGESQAIKVLPRSATSQTLFRSFQKKPTSLY